MKTILFILCLLSITVNGQTPSFSKVFYDSALNDLYLRDATATLDSNIMILTEPAGLIKVNAEGDKLWAKGFVGENYINTSFEHIQFKSISATVDSAFLIGGSTLDTITNRKEAIYLKVDYKGDTIWTGAISDSNYELTIKSIVALKDSGGIAVGTAFLQPSLEEKSIIARISKTGTLIWSKIIASNSVYFVREGADSNFVMGGDFGLIKFDNSGEVLWANDYIGNGTSSFLHTVNDLVPLDDGYMVYFDLDNVVVLAKLDFSGGVVWANTYSVSSLIGGRHVLNEANSYFFVSIGENGFMKIDSLGDIVSSHKVWMNTREYVPFGDDGYFLGEGPTNGVKTSDLYVKHIGIVKIDTNEVDFYCGAVFNIAHQAKIMTVTPFVDSTISFGVSSSLFIDTLGVLINEKIGCVSVLGAIDEKNAKLVTVYPNPSNGKFTVNKETTENMVIYFYNTLGDLILTQDLSQDFNEIDLSNVVNGIYFYQVLSEQNKRSFGKLIVSK